MPGPCPLALALTRVPAKKWSTKADLVERLSFAHRVLLEHLHLPLTTEALAELAAISPDHFLVLFRETYGVTPAVLRGQQRLLKARSLIESGVSPTDAAILVGYSSMGTFSRRFRAAFGCSPSEIKNASASPGGTRLSSRP